MLAKIVFLFFICEICVAGNGRGYISNSQGNTYQPPHCPSGYCSQNTQFSNAFPINSSPQFVDRNLHSQGIIQQSNWQDYPSNAQRPIYQPPRCPSGDCPQNPPFFNAFPINSSPEFGDSSGPSQGNWQDYPSNAQHPIYQPPRCPSGYCPQNPPFFNAFPIKSSPEFADKSGPSQGDERQPQLAQLKLAQDEGQTTDGIVNEPPTLSLGYSEQDNGRSYPPNPQEYAYQPPNPQGYVQQPPQCPSGQCFETTTKPPVLSAPLYLHITGPSTTNRISDTECYYKYSGAAISGGDSAEPAEFPHMAAIGYRKPTGGYNYQCGGTLISKTFILTAAHCRSVNGQTPAVARIGGARLDDTDISSQPEEITNIYSHPAYKRKQVYDDIALLKFKYGTIFTPACLWTKKEINYNTVTAIGYGQTEFGLSTSTDLLKVDLQLYSNEVCKSYYTPRFRIEKGLVDTQICAGDFNKVKDTCPGDSGGPLLTRIAVKTGVVPFVLGVTSFGPGCAEGIPGVYTKVFPYLDWIESIVWPEG